MKQDYPKYQHIAEIELRYKPSIKLPCLPEFFRSNDVYRIIMKFWDPQKIEFIEQLKIMLMRKNRVIGICNISTGNVNNTIADPKLVFSIALKANATNIILVHNHPSGNLKPSRADQELTDKLAAIGRILDLTLADHLIITNNGYYSFLDEGTL